jgi:hypothetical protein
MLSIAKKSFPKMQCLTYRPLSAANRLIFMSAFSLFFMVLSAQAQILQSSRLSAEDGVGNIEWRSFMDEPVKFEKGSWLINVGLGLRGDTKITEFTSKVTLPAMSLLVEKAVGKNFGVGITAGVQMWEADRYGYPYRQFNLGLRVAYHLNILEKLDPYVAASGVVRYMDVKADDYYNYKMKVSPGFLIGARYYLTEKLGAFCEIGDETLSWLRFGLALKLK